MKNYLNYLKGKPIKILYLIGVTLFFTIVQISLLRWGLEDGWTIGTFIFMFFVYFGACYHPYYEWNDGIKEAERIKNYQDSLKK